MNSLRVFTIFYYMKTSILLPDKICFEADEAARSMGISRSVLYMNALTEYLVKNCHKNIQGIIEVYSEEYYSEFEPITNAVLENVKIATKNCA